MAGLGTALAYVAGGAAKGLGTGWMADVQKTREEKLRKLELASAEGMETRRLQHATTEGIANRASQEKMTEAQQATTLAVSQLQATVQREGHDLTRDLSADEIQANRDLAKAAQDHALRLNATLKPYQDPKFPDDPSKVIYRYAGPDGTPFPKLIDPDTGEEISAAPQFDDTDDMKNIKALHASGKYTYEAAADLVLGAKATNTWQKSKESYFKAMTDSAGNLQVLTPKQYAEYEKLAGEMADRDFPGERPGSTVPGTGGETSATEPASTVPAALPSRPTGASDEVLIKQANDKVKKGLVTRQRAKEILKHWEVDAAAAAAGGF